MDTLGAESFAPTQRTTLRGEGNTDPRKAYRQQAAVELSAEGFSFKILQIIDLDRREFWPWMLV
jgi:hypothetical protein